MIKKKYGRYVHHRLNKYENVCILAKVIRWSF